MPKKTITITAMERPALFADMVASLTRCGLDRWHVYVAIEPGDHQEALAQIAMDLLPSDQITILRNPKQLGVRENPKAAIDAAFGDRSDFNLCLEEDFLLAPDALQLADWYIANAQPHWVCLNLLAASCGSTGNLSAPAYPELLFESKGFSSIGLGLTRRNWDQLRPHWSAPTAIRRKGYHDIAVDGWDHALFAHLLKHPALRSIHPVAARCTHVGATGTYCTPTFQDAAFGHIALALRDADAAARDGFSLVPIARLPQQIVGHVRAQQDFANLLAQQVTRFEPTRSYLYDRLSHWNRKRRRRNQ
ncbi:hypothetical protein [Yoonia sp. I 8.24]|uniref:hypothetical protein n=1 Tax=Yoonia sp. I 8.24 TaxID=1537229 RepID=UPI001EDED47B|nr:hypothetical protein [Yoonia sp. I 8.24]MCG3268824.1 hypothetical protein [Yoonia sp. I 8.24]